RKLVEQLRGAAKITIQDPREVVDATAKDLDLSEEKKLDLLRYFAKEGDTVFGLVNGITRLAQDESDFDRRVDLERYAGQRLEKLVVAKQCSPPDPTMTTAEPSSWESSRPDREAGSDAQRAGG